MSWWLPVVGVIVPGLVALMWIRPWGQIDSLILQCEVPKSA